MNEKVESFSVKEEQNKLTIRCNNKNFYYIPFESNGESTKSYRGIIKEKVQRFLKNDKNGLTVYASFRINPNYKIMADVDNIVFYNLGINNYFNSFVIELDRNWRSENNGFISEYYYEKCSNTDLKIYSYSKLNQIISFNFSIKENSKVYEIWFYAREELCKKISSPNYVKELKSDNGYILELKIIGKGIIRYDSSENISIKKIIDSIMLSLCSIEEDDFVTRAILAYKKIESKNSDNENCMGFFKVNRLFKIQSNPPDDKLVGIIYKFEGSESNVDKYEISVRLFSVL